MKAEPGSHEGHDALISPRLILATGEDARGEGPGQEGRVAEKKKETQTEKGERKAEDRDGEGVKQVARNASNTDVLPRAVLSVGESLRETLEVEGKEDEEREPVDQHPEQGLIPGSSVDGLSQDMATRDDGGRREEGEEARVPKTLPAPKYVSKVERQEHELTHTPYRSWCEHCVRCRGRNAQHRKKEGEDEGGQVPRIAFDYFFMSHADESASANPMLVMIDESTGENTRER